MAEPRHMPEGAEDDFDDEGGGRDESAGGGSGRSWRQAWHLPVLLLSLALLGIAIYAAAPTREPDRFDEVLDEVAAMLEAGELSRAEQRLKEIRNPLNERGHPLLIARSHLLWGDLIYQQDRLHRWDNPENHQKVAEHYRHAVRQGASPDAEQVQRWAETLVSLDRYDEAMQVLERLPGDHARRRPAVLRHILERRVDLGDDAEDLYRLLGDFERSLAGLSDQDRIRRERLWAAKTRARITLEQPGVDAPAQAARYLERMLPRFLTRGPQPDVAPLKVLLGDAYRREGNLEDAEAQYRSARALIESNDPLLAHILVGLGEIVLAGGERRDGSPAEAAHAYFRRATEQFPMTEPYVDALIGRAHAEALMDQDEEALAHFARAVGQLRDLEQPSPRTIEQLQQRVIGHHEIHYERESFDKALDYIEKLKPLYDEAMPDALLARFAVTWQRLAERKIEEAEAAAQRARQQRQQGRAEAEDIQRLSEVRRALNRDAAQAWEWAGDYYERYAHSAFADARVNDAADALWRAAEAFDHAQRWDRSIRAYQRFSRDHAQDPRQLEARHRIGMAFLALGNEADVAVARDQFVELIEQQRHETSPAVMESYVPLAQAYLALGKPEEAKQTLLEVMNHRNTTPQSDVYRDALIELCKLHYRQGDYVKAIERLTEATDPRRYGESEIGPRLRFMLANSLRLSVGAIEEALERAMQGSRRRELQALRTERLERAYALYNRVIDELEPIRDLDPTMLSEIEHEYLRNALVYRADCMFDLGRYREAIDLYSTAAADESWHRKPGMLVPLVQIVNAYVALDEPEHARAANRRAMDFLESIPDEAFDDPDLPMDRRHWQQWLRSNEQLHELRDRRANR